MSELIYKIIRESELSDAEEKGVFNGSADDLRDGFIHLSTADQLAGTLAKHFAGEQGLHILAIDPSQLGKHLRWEPSRGGALFPHLYRPLQLDEVCWCRPVSAHGALPELTP